MNLLREGHTFMQARYMVEQEIYQKFWAHCIGLEISPRLAMRKIVIRHLKKIGLVDDSVPTTVEYEFKDKEKRKKDLIEMRQQIDDELKELEL